MNRPLFRAIASKTAASSIFWDEKFVNGCVIHSPDKITSRIINDETDVEVDSDTIGRFTNLENKDGHELCAGDLIFLYGKLYTIVDHVWKFSFERNLVYFGENKEIDLDEDTAYEAVLVGNIHQNIDLVKSEKIKYEQML